MADDTSGLPTPDNDEKLMKIEAKSAVREVKFAVDYVDISEKLDNTDEQAYLNVKTKEGDMFCVELTLQGFRVSRKSYAVTLVHGGRLLFRNVGTDTAWFDVRCTLLVATQSAEKLRANKK